VVTVGGDGPFEELAAEVTDLAVRRSKERAENT
jgi:hypothetical protein